MCLLFGPPLGDSGRFSGRFGMPNPRLGAKCRLQRRIGDRKSQLRGRKGTNLPSIVPARSARGAHIAVAGIGGARNVAISSRISANRRREMATSALGTFERNSLLRASCPTARDRRE